ncbi:origin recognition complex subunit 1 [Sporobolomyces koalae]|uniref:origin recognition complex subunit 1 n=1 Tax=Sporobolomyces koalae TaxID=500713 RepID=UPI0031738FFF
MPDEWSTPSYVPTKRSEGPSTPSKRASRHLGISNQVDHSSFIRTITASDSSGDSNTTEYRIGDVVIVDESVTLKQKFLHPPLYQAPAPKRKRKQPLNEGDDYSGWRHEDQLERGDKVAVITRLYEDVNLDKLALVRWFARPGAVWGPEGPDDDEVGHTTLPYELYYTADSSHLTEARLLEHQRKSPSKHRESSSAHYVSAVASLKTPLHSDPVPLTAIKQLVEILSPSSTPQPTGPDQDLSVPEITSAMQRVCPTFLVRTVYDVKPVSGAGFWSDLNECEEGGWEAIRQRGIENWNNHQEVDKKVQGWHVEPAFVESEPEDEAEIEQRMQARKQKEIKRRKQKAALEAELAKQTRAIESEEEEEDEDEDDEDAFRPKRRRAGDSSSSSSEEDDEETQQTDYDEEEATVSPRKRQSRNRASPSKAKRARPAATKQNRLLQRKKHDGDVSATSHNPIPPLLSASYLASLPTPIERAKALLHVSATPDSLPCREEQRDKIRQFVEDAVWSRSGGCLYVHGVPGTGKTATVHSVVRELQKDPDMDPFTFVEINGMKISEPNAAFSHLWNALNNKNGITTKISPKAALAALEGWFANPDPARKTTVVLVDELDQMLTKRQDVLYNFFNWPHSPHSRLVVIAVANTMDLPERELSGKIRSRLGTNRIPFQPYTWNELKRILGARLSLVTSASDADAGKEAVPVKLFDDVALQKIAKSVAGISGDARKALDVARRTLDRVALRTASAMAPDQVPTEIKCTIQDATAAYNEMTKSGPGFFVKRLSLHQKILLLALVQCVRRAGVPQVELDSVLSWHDNFLKQTHLLSSAAGTGPSKSDLLTLVSELHAMRLLATESQRLDVFQKVKLGIEDGDVFAALREDEVLKNHVPQA